MAMILNSPTDARHPTVDERAEYATLHDQSSWSSSAQLKTSYMTNIGDESDFNKTWSRVLVEKYLSKQKWYNPHADKKDCVDGTDDTSINFDAGDRHPSLRQAWAFYEHVTLPRRIIGGNDADKRAPPGSGRGTELYSILYTREDELFRWGIGVELYFNTLKYLSVLFIIVGLANVHSIVYYASGDYTEGSTSNPLHLLGSAICTSHDWVQCVDCNITDWESSRDMFGHTDNGDKIVRTNECGAAPASIGWINIASFLVFAAAFTALYKYQESKEIQADEGKISSSDYSVVVLNPPSDAFDPGKWRNFFTQFEVGSLKPPLVSIALNNEKLLWALATLRKLRLNLAYKLPKGIDMKDALKVKEEVDKKMKEFYQNITWSSCLGRLLVAFFLKPFGFAKNERELLSKITELEDKVNSLQRERYEVVKVFVTMETEEGQRNALTILDRGKFEMIDTMFDDDSIPKFEETVLYIEEAREPSSIRWGDLSASWFKRKWSEITTALFVVVCFMAQVYWIYKLRNTAGPLWAAYFIMLANILFPILTKLLLSFERHADEESRQTSIYLKITLFRWINTAALLLYITPTTHFLSTDSNAILPTLASIFLFEITLTPLLRALDIFSNISKHILAPRAKSQRQMNQRFVGTRYNLGERYTDLTKIVFLCFVYSVLFPASFLLGGIAMAVQYWTDKFCLLRMWAPSPDIDARVGQFSRKYMFNFALLAFAMCSAYMYAGFPYDNLCHTGEFDDIVLGKNDSIKLLNGAEITKNVSITLLNDAVISVTIHTKQKYKYCNQYLWGKDFPPSFTNITNWMEDSQVNTYRFFGIVSIVALVIFLLFMSWVLIQGLKHLFQGTYEPSGDNMNMDFSSCLRRTGIVAYIPFIHIPGFNFNCLACDISDFDENLIGWQDQFNSYDFYNLINDVPYSPVGENAHRPIFSIAKHWPRFPPMAEDPEFHK